MSTINFRKNTQHPPMPETMICENKHMNRAIIGGMVGMFLYGLMLPTDWQQLFGPLAQPIVWTANTVPSIERMAAVSSIPELIKGFFGVGVYVPPLFAILHCRGLSARLCYAFSRSSRPFWKTFIFIYLLACPAMLLSLYLFYINPILDGVLNGNTRGSLIFTGMLKYRFILAVFGSFVTVGFGVTGWILAIALLGPIQLIIKGE